jgi:hypothetical protein
MLTVTLPNEIEGVCLAIVHISFMWQAQYDGVDKLNTCSIHVQAREALPFSKNPRKANVF